MLQQVVMQKKIVHLHCSTDFMFYLHVPVDVAYGISLFVSKRNYYNRNRNVSFQQLRLFLHSSNCNKKWNNFYNIPYAIDFIYEG